MFRRLFLIVCVLMTCGRLAGQDPQTTMTFTNQNSAYVNGIAPGYWPTAGSGLTLNLSAGTALCGTPPMPVYYSGGSLTLTASATNYVFLNEAASCAPAFNTTAFTSASLPIATVTTGSSSITAIRDLRLAVTQAAAAANVKYVSQASGSDIGAKISAQDTALASTAGTIVIDSAGTLTSNWTLSANHDLVWAAPVTISSSSTCPVGTLNGNNRALGTGASGGITLSCTNQGSIMKPASSTSNILVQGLWVFATTPSYGYLILDGTAGGVSNVQVLDNYVNGATLAAESTSSNWLVQGNHVVAPSYTGAPCFGTSGGSNIQVVDNNMENGCDIEFWGGQANPSQSNFNGQILWGTYQSGGTISGTSGQTCTLSSFSGGSGGSGATATVTLTSSSSPYIAAGTPITITAAGSGFYGSNPTSATLGNGTASCKGTATLTTAFGVIPGLTDVIAKGNSVNGGSLWASGVQRIQYVANKVINSGDVGIDCEACIGELASGNIVQDSKNGNFSTFYETRDARFTGNTSIISVSTNTVNGHFFINGIGTPFGQSDNLTIDSDNMICQDPVNLCVSALDLNNSVDRLTFKNNYSRNSWRDFYSNTITTNVGGIHYADISGNQFIHTVAAGAAFYALTINCPNAIPLDSGGSWVTVSGNKFISSVSQPSGSGAIDLAHCDPTGAYTWATISDNYFGGGEPLQNEVTLSNSTSGWMMTALYSNQFSYGTVTGSGGYLGLSRIDGNIVFQDGASPGAPPWPGSKPTGSGLAFFPGEFVQNSNANANGVYGWANVGFGAPGTWAAVAANLQTAGVYAAVPGTTGCTTGSGQGSTCSTPITVTWPSAFADTNYSASCSPSGAATNYPSAPYVASKAAGSITVNYQALTLAAAKWATIDCWAVHN